MTTAVEHRPWSTVLVGLAGMRVAIGVVALVVGLVLVAQADPGSSDRVDVLGLVVFALVVVVAGVVAGLTVVGRRRADAGSPATLRAGAIGAIVTVVIDAITVVVEIGSRGISVDLLIPIGTSAVLLLSAVKVVGATRTVVAPQVGGPIPEPHP